MLVIINYEMGNLMSISNMLKKLGHNSILSNKKKDISNASKLILPGVGAFDQAMKNIKSLGIYDVINDKVINDKTPILGICLGMQLLTKGSEEGIEPGFGWINAKTIRFKNTSLKVPHMGWNSVSIKKNSPLFDSENKVRRYYFVHSYYVEYDQLDHTLATTYYGDEFSSMLHEENIYGAQFHPEKSHNFGMEILDNFSKL